MQFVLAFGNVGLTKQKIVAHREREKATEATLRHAGNECMDVPL